MNAPLNLNNLLICSEVLEQLESKYPEIKNNLENLKINPNCECKNDVINFLNEKANSSTSDYDFLHELIKNHHTGCSHGGSEIRPQGVTSIYLTGENNGPMGYFENPELSKVHRVEKTPEAWGTFIKEIRQKVLFSNFSVVDKGDYLEVYLI